MGATEKFTTRWGLLAATLGMAIGAGNIWRFPRVAAANGGAAFFVAWMVALLTWSLPLLLLEYHWGSRARGSPLRAFWRLVGRRWIWAGGFVVCCCCAIMFYYTVVTGWSLAYLLQVPWLSNSVVQLRSGWQDFQGSGYAWLAALVVLAGVSLVMFFGVRRGVERLCRWLVPGLFVLLAIAALRACMLPGSGRGLRYLFAPEFERLGDLRLWMEAFSQSAWSTGAGWGLLLVYAGYGGRREHVLGDCLVTGLGNNIASLLAALAIVPTLFATLPEEKALQVASTGNQGLAFIWVPHLLLGSGSWAGRLMLLVFFVALLLAAVSSLVAMAELAVRALLDLGLQRRQAAWLVLVLGAAGATPAALSSSYFENQDWVWGLGLLVSGSLFCAGALISRQLPRDLPGGRFTAGWLWGSWHLFVPLAALAMLVWWLWRSQQWSGAGWFDPGEPLSLTTCLVQWSLLLAVLVASNRILLRRLERGERS